MLTTPPILFLIFNRVDTTARVFEAIRMARPQRLYVAADGPRHDRPGEAERCAAVRRIAGDVDWPCEVRTLYRDANLGCRDGLKGAITWFFEHEEEGVILEDDCLPHPFFFQWCATMLDRYRHEPHVMCVTGNNFQSDMGGWPHSYYYSIYPHCWGWASWRRAWALYDFELKTFEPQTARAILSRLSEISGFAQAWTKKIESGRFVDTWDYAWTWSCWSNGGLTCTPRTNLVSNIGFGPEATHTLDQSSEWSKLPVEALHPPYISPPKLIPERRFDDYVTRSHFGIHHRSFFRRVVGRLKRIALSLF